MITMLYIYICITNIIYLYKCYFPVIMKHHHHPITITITTTPSNITITKTPKPKSQNSFHKHQSHSLVSKKPKRVITLDQVIDLLKIPKHNRLKQENTLISAYLINHFPYFKSLKTENNPLKLEKIVSSLTLETFNKGEHIIHYGDECDKTYFLLKGNITFIKPTLLQKQLKLSEYITLMRDIRYNELDIKKYNRHLEKNDHISINLDTLFKLDNNATTTSTHAYFMNKTMMFYIEHDIIIGNYKHDYTFNDNACISPITSSTITIRVNSTSWLVSINNSDYMKVMRELEEKRLEKELIAFRKEYPLFQHWNVHQLIRMFGSFQSRTLTQGDYLYKQNENSEYIYIIKSGTFQMYTLVSFGWLRQFFEYISNARNNVINELSNCSYKLPFKESELKRIYDIMCSKQQQSPCVYDVLKNNGVRCCEDKSTTRVVDFENIKQEEEQLVNPFNVFKILIRVINYKDVIGYVEALEMKQRFTFVKCVSQQGEVLLLKRFDFMKLMNVNEDEDNRKMLNDIITQKKMVLCRKILRAAKHKGKYYAMLFDHKYETLLENIEMNINNYYKQQQQQQCNKHTRNKNHSGINDYKCFGNSISSNCIFTTMNYNARNKHVVVKGNSNNNNEKVKRYLGKYNKPRTTINKNMFNTKTIMNSRSSGSKISLTDKKGKLQHSRLSHFYLLSKQLSSFNNNNSNCCTYKSYSNNESNGGNHVTSHSKIKSFNTNTTLTPVHSSSIIKTFTNKHTYSYTHNNIKTTTLPNSNNVDFGQLSANKKVLLLKNFRDVFDEKVIKHKDDKVYSFVKTIPDIQRRSTSCN